MGRMVETAATSLGHEVVGCISSTNWDNTVILNADICIEFTSPHAAIDNISRAANLKKPIVVGTTGWYENLYLVEEIAKKHNIGILYAPNFSLGVHLLLNILSNAAALMNSFPEYDAAGFECHHNRKKDAPSGTAMAIASTMQSQMPRINPFPFSSLRCGSTPGTHTVVFDSPHDTITITHSARTQEGFAIGAVKAAEWLLGKKGLYTLENYMEEVIYGT